MSLDRLIEAVGAGLPSPTNWRDFYEPPIDAEQAILCHRAYHGSLDAAVALKEALLPGWGWAVHGNGSAHLWKQLDTVNTLDEIPSRALLLAVLRAVREERG